MKNKWKTSFNDQLLQWNFVTIVWIWLWKVRDIQRQCSWVNWSDNFPKKRNKTVMSCHVGSHNLDICYLSQKWNWFHKHNNQLGCFTLYRASQIITTTTTAFCINCMRMLYGNDTRTYELYFSGSENKAWKKFRPVRDLNPWPLRYQCSALRYRRVHELSNPVRAWIFYRPYIHYHLSSVHNCEDRFHIPFLKFSSHNYMFFIYLQSCMRMFKTSKIFMIHAVKTLFLLRRWRYDNWPW